MLLDWRGATKDLNEGSLLRWKHFQKEWKTWKRSWLFGNPEKNKTQLEGVNFLEAWKNLQDRFHILAYRDLSCHRLEAACFSSWHLCSRGTKSWCVSWIRFVKRCGAQHDQGGSMGSIVDLTTAFDFEKEQRPLGVEYFPNFSLTKEFVDHPFLGSPRSQRDQGSPQKMLDRPLSALWLATSSRLIASQEKDEGVSWSRQKKCCWVWCNWLVLSLWWFNVCVSLLMCFAVWSGKVLFTSGLVEHLCSLSIKSLSTQRLCENYTIRQHVFTCMSVVTQLCPNSGRGCKKFMTCWSLDFGLRAG